MLRFLSYYIHFFMLFASYKKKMIIIKAITITISL